MSITHPKQSKKDELMMERHYHRIKKAPLIREEPFFIPT